jgi:hypothetical protein
MNWINRKFFSPFKKEGVTCCEGCPLLPNYMQKVIATCGGGFHSRLYSGQRWDKSYYPRFWGSENCKLVSVTVAVEEKL